METSNDTIAEQQKAVKDVPNINDAITETELIFQSAPDAMLKIDIDGQILKANTQASALFKYQQQELLTLNIAALIAMDIRHKHQDYIRKFFNQGSSSKLMGSNRGNLHGLDKYGNKLPVEITISLVKLEKGTFALAIIRDVREREDLINSLRAQLQKNQELLHISTINELTQAYNHKYFKDNLKQELLNAHKHNDKLSLMVMDIDFFKKVNDSYGHLVGDKILSEFAAKIMAVKRNCDIFCRVGGEEFTLILPQTNHQEAMVIAQRINDAIRTNHFNISNTHNIKITVSIGITSNLGHNDCPENMFQRADSALYQAKQNGRDMYTYL